MEEQKLDLLCELNKINTIICNTKDKKKLTQYKGKVEKLHNSMKSKKKQKTMRKKKKQNKLSMLPSMEFTEISSPKILPEPKINMTDKLDSNMTDKLDYNMTDKLDSKDTFSIMPPKPDFISNTKTGDSNKDIIVSDPSKLDTPSMDQNTNIDMENNDLQSQSQQPPSEVEPEKKLDNLKSGDNSNEMGMKSLNLD